MSVSAAKEVCFASMLETLMKYGSVYMLLLASAFFLCFVADEICDSQHLAKQTTASACMTLLAEDLDFDEEDDDEALIGLFTGTIGRGIVSIHETSGRKTMKSKSPKALQRGQVRRHSPRNDLPCSHNYTLLSTTKSGVDLLHATFFVRNNILHNGERGLETPWSRSILQTKSYNL